MTIADTVPIGVIAVFTSSGSSARRVTRERAEERIAVVAALAGAEAMLDHRAVKRDHAVLEVKRQQRRDVALRTRTADPGAVIAR